MKFDFTIEESKVINDVWIVTPSISKDSRGTIWTSFLQHKIESLITAGLQFKHDKFSRSKHNVLRGIRGCCPGLMENVTNELISWMFSELKLSKIKLKVFSDNYKAINLYERCKMLTIGNIPLKREFNNQGWKWIPVKSSNGYAERYYSIMEIMP